MRPTLRHLSALLLMATLAGCASWSSRDPLHIDLVLSLIHI